MSALERTCMAQPPNRHLCRLPFLPGRQFVAKTEGGKRTVAGVHWDYDGYGATLKKVGAGRLA